MPTNAAASRKVRNEQSWHKILITICAYCVKLNFKVTKKFVQAQYLYECVCGCVGVRVLGLYNDDSCNR